MTPFSDPMGEALSAYQNGKTNAEITVISNITEDDKIPVSYLFRSYQEMPALEQLALQECTGSVLDLGAGAGSHALWLQQKGMHVTAIDISPLAVAVMKRRGLEQVLQADFWQLMPTEKYDTILLLMNGIGLSGTLEKLPLFFDRLKNFLQPGGQILLESSDILYMFEDEDGSVLLDLNSAYYGEVEYQMTYENTTGAYFPWLFIDYGLLTEHAAKAGLDSEVLYEGENGEYLAKLTFSS